jgi:hypothetical protein
MTVAIAKYSDRHRVVTMQMVEQTGMRLLSGIVCSWIARNGQWLSLGWCEVCTSNTGTAVRPLTFFFNEPALRIDLDCAFILTESARIIHLRLCTHIQYSGGVSMIP